jgi:predicted nucleic acid-binding protein
MAAARVRASRAEMDFVARTTSRARCTCASSTGSTSSTIPSSASNAAGMEAHGIDTVMTFDKGFDVYPGIRRLRA